MKLQLAQLFLLVVALEAQTLDWWQHAVFYQIYPRSFKDSDNDGKGDIQGIISKLDHVKDAGVDALWLSPVMSSPQVDAGYDISNFTDIHYEYGTLEDFDQMVARAKELGLKVILDFVPNHSSDQHEWFIKSENREPGYEDFYVWRDPNPVTGGVPNNWISVFKYSAWEWSPKRQQYYLHQFAKEQPDLNYRDPNLVQAMKDVLVFWLDRGVDGFRVDAIPHMFEDETFPDEPPSNNPNANPWEWESLDHIYTKDHPGTYDMVYQFRALLDEYKQIHGGDTRVLMTEAYTSLPNTMLYYGDGERLGAHFSFNFVLITDLNKDSQAQDFVDRVEAWMSVMPSEYTPNWVLGNHDQHRVATRYGKPNADGLNMLMALLPGVGVTYNGEEIGMENGEVTYEQGHDPNACNAPPEDFDKFSRDFERTPFHWDDSVNAGFNEGAEPWLPLSSKYLENNLAAQKVEGVRSHYHIYQELMQLRQNEVLINGDYSIVAVSSHVLGLLRKSAGTPGYILIFNIGFEAQTVDLSSAFPGLASQLQVVIPSLSSVRNPGDSLSSNDVHLGAYEAVVAVEV